MATLPHETARRLDVLGQALAAEEREVRGRVDALLADGSPRTLEERGLLLRKARVLDQRPTLLGRVRVTVGDDQNREGHVDRFDVRAGGVVVMLERDEKGRPVPVGHGVVARRRRGQLQVVFDGVDAARDLDVDDAVDLLRGEDEVTIRRLRDGLDRARAATGRTARLVEVLLGVGPPRATRLPDDDGAALGLHDGALNDDQRRAALHALLAEDVALVHGPPGTGKTHVLVDVIQRCVDRGERVLALCASNAAVDHLALSLLRARPTLALARAGDPARAHEQLEAHTLVGLTEAHPHRQLARDLVDQARALLGGARRRSDRSREAWAREREARVEAGRLFAEARRLERIAADDVLGKTRVLCGTLTGRLDDLLGDDARFDVLVVDEASQALTPAVLCGVPWVGRVVLAGDHKQLPPVVLAAEAARLGLGQTAFATLCAADGKGAVSHMLTEQHRMHEDIMRWPSQASYDGRLVAHPSVAAALLALPGDDGARTSRPAQPLDVIDTAGAGFDEESPPQSPSKENPGEARLVALLVDDLVQAGLSAADIGVITPYAAQSARLQAQLAALVDAGLEVDSVDGFQGREKEAILVSAVRSNVDGEVGFVADARRLNVALTRAKKKLIVIADSATLSSDAGWRSLFDDAIARGCYRSVFEIDGAVA
ncbi:MAG: AAA family ATPase [Deltaproteobacteria bacterium]|nr:AAA family ATPase [Deltaproteobacteria bacterium]